MRFNNNLTNYTRTVYSVYRPSEELKTLYNDCIVHALKLYDTFVENNFLLKLKKTLLNATRQDRTETENS